MPNYQSTIKEILERLTTLSNWTVSLKDHSILDMQRALRSLCRKFENETSKEALDSLLAETNNIALWTVSHDIAQPGERPEEAQIWKMQETLADIWDKYSRKIMDAENS